MHANGRARKISIARTPLTAPMTYARHTYRIETQMERNLTIFTTHAQAATES